jgi:hypothetical protein
MALTITIPLPEQVAYDILTTAWEQGISYWAEGKEVHRLADLSVTSFTVRDAEDPEAEWVTADYDTVHDGLQKILDGEVRVRPDFYRQCLTVKDPEDVDIDADAADVIVQVGLFGKIVFG